LATWKSASSTLYLRLASLNESQYPRFYYFNPFLDRVTHQHLTCAEFEALPEASLGYLRAAFVRNPYDRFFSGFGQVRRDVRLQPYAQFPAPWIKELVMTQLAKNHAQLVRANYDFNQWVRSISEDQILDIGQNATFPLHPAHYWTHIGGTRRVDFVGRVEDFESDFGRFCEDAGISPDEFKEGNANAGKFVRIGDAASAYRYAHLFDRYSIDKINKPMALVFERLDYRRL
jgi:hypothetical protein